DGRAGAEAAELRADPAAADLAARTGPPVHAVAPLAKLRWFARHEPATWATARHWVGVKELVLHWLTGELVTERSSASGTGLAALATGTWDPGALALAGLGADRLAPVLATTGVLPLAATAAHEVGLAAGTPVVVGAADGPLANVGVGALDRGVAGVSVGTSGAGRVTV